MEEYTNPSQPNEAKETMEDDDLFGDISEEDDDLFSDAEPEEKAEAPEEQTSAPDAAEKPDEKPQTLRIKYNGQEQEITLEQAAELAQKGMNYDKVLNERNGLRVDARASELMHRLAEANGMDVEQYVGFVENQQKVVMLQKEAQNIRTKYPDMPDDAVQEMAEMRVNEKHKAAEESAATRRRSEEEARQKPWMDFLREFPDYKDGRELPRGVAEGIERGLTPVEAMLRHQQTEYEQRIKELEAKLTTKEQNEKSRKASVGSAASTAATKVEDAFLSAFDG